MRILLRWLVEHAWVVYIVCAIGALLYVVRALAAQRERSLALFTLEHEAATVRAVRAWAVVFVFIAVALVVYIGVTFVLNNVPAYDPSTPLPTATPSSGVNPPTPSATPTDPGGLPTLPAKTATPSSPTPSPLPTEISEPAPTETPTPPALVTGAFSGQMDVSFGDFGKLIGYELSSTEISAGTSVRLILYWQGLEGTSPADYVVFTHLLSEDGRLLAQHDGPPADGSEPTSDWETGETIQDTHELTFRSGGMGYTGQATLMVGLYDPGDIGARVMTSEGRDYVTIPVSINVVAE